VFRMPEYSSYKETVLVVYSTVPILHLNAVRVSVNFIKSIVVLHRLRKRSNTQQDANVIIISQHLFDMRGKLQFKT